jgi:hypothetical protein
MRYNHQDRELFLNKGINVNAANEVTFRHAPSANLRKQIIIALKDSLAFCYVGWQNCITLRLLVKAVDTQYR